MSEHDLSNGWWNWTVHKPQSAEDWRKVAVRSIADWSYDPSVGSPLFQALYQAEVELARLREALDVARDALGRAKTIARRAS